MSVVVVVPGVVIYFLSSWTVVRKFWFIFFRLFMAARSARIPGGDGGGSGVTIGSRGSQPEHRA